MNLKLLRGSVESRHAIKHGNGLGRATAGMGTVVDSEGEDLTYSIAGTPLMPILTSLSGVTPE